jgi:hypothetical protein
LLKPKSHPVTRCIRSRSLADLAREHGVRALVPANEVGFDGSHADRFAAALMRMAAIANRSMSQASTSAAPGMAAAMATRPETGCNVEDPAVPDGFGKVQEIARKRLAAGSCDRPERWREAELSSSSSVRRHSSVASSAT